MTKPALGVMNLAEEGDIVVKIRYINTIWGVMQCHNGWSKKSCWEAHWLSLPNRNIISLVDMAQLLLWRWIILQFYFGRSVTTSTKSQQGWRCVFAQHYAKVWLTGDGRYAKTHVRKYRAFNHINPQTKNIYKNSNASACQAFPPVLKENSVEKKNAFGR